MIYMSKTNPLIVLDPGHGPYTNPYPAASGYYEGTQVYKLMLVLKKRLEDHGIRVITTRHKLSDDPDLTTRGSTAGKNNADLFISLHSDAIGNYVSTAKGVSAYYSIQDTATNKPLAAKISAGVSALMGTRDRGALTRIGNGGLDYYGVIRSSANSGCKNAFLIEHGFHSNTDDVKWLISDVKLAQIAEVETKILCEYFGKTYKSSTAVSTIDIKSNTTSTAVNATKTVTINKALYKYTNAANALSANKSLAAGTLQPGTYYIYKEYNGATNLTKTAGVAGSWVVITANDVTPIEVPVEKPVAEPDKFTTSNDLKIYMSAADATSKINALKDSNGKFKSYKAGTYYVYKKYSGSVLNISTKQNVAGAWVNINDAIEETKVFHKGDIVGFVAGRTPYYSDGTRVPLYVIVEVTGKKKSPVISVDMNNAVTIYNVEKSVPSKYLEVLIPANDETLAMANQYADSHTTKAELTSTIESKYGSLKLLANCKGYKEFVEYMDSLLEDDVVIDTDTDLDPIMGTSYLTAIQLAKFVKSKNPAFDSNIANEFIERCKKYGIRGDVAFCQSILETGWFKYEGSAVTADQHNYAGLGVTSNGVKGLSFGSVGIGVEAQLQHLYAYATREPLPNGIPMIDPRFTFVNRGSAPRWVDLNGKWSSGIEYGQKILAIYKDACNSL